MLTSTLPLVPALLLLAPQEAALGDLVDEDASPAVVDLTGAAVVGSGRPGPVPAPTPSGGPPPIEDFLAVGVPPEGDAPSAVRFTPDGTKIVVAGRTSRNLGVFDAATRAYLNEVPLSGGPGDLAISADGQYAVTANLFEDTVSIVDLAAATELATVAVGDQPSVVRITPDSTRAVVGNAVDQTLSVVDLASATELVQIPGAGFNASTSVAFESGAVYTRSTGFEVASNTIAVHPDFLNDQIDFFDLVAGTVTSVPSSDPFRVALTPNGATAVVVHGFGTPLISVVDVGTQTITKTIPLGQSATGSIAVKPDGTKAAVTVSNAVVIVDLVADTVSAPLATLSVNDLLPTADGNYVLCVGFSGSLIEWATDSIVNSLNGIVSTTIGAVSPVGSRAAMVANVFGEDMLVVDTNGVFGLLEAQVPSGAPPEADAVRKVAISADGARAVTTSILSDTASVIDLASGTIEAVVAVGDRPADVAITPDGALAVVANLDSDFASVIDLGTFAVTNVTISTRASQVEISPDGQTAYLAVVASGDGVWRIDLNTLSVSGPKLAAGNMGGIFYLFQQTSGMTLSHDGATLVTCGTYDDTITIVDTATWSVAANVAVGDYPVRALFSADDGTIWVALKNDDRIAEVTNAGAASSVARVIDVGGQPFEMVAKADASRLWVANAQDDTVGVVDLGAGVMTGAIPVPESPQGLHLNAAESCLFVTSGTWSVTLGPSAKVSIDPFGAFSVIDPVAGTVSHQLLNALPPAMLAFDPADRFGLVPSPFGDGLARFRIEGGPTVYCTAKTSSAGCVTAVTTSDPNVPPVSGANDYDVVALAVQGQKPGIFFVGQSGPAATPFVGGTLCVTPPLGRGPVQLSGGTGSTSCDGSFAQTINDGASLFDPGPGGTVWVQTWYRDPAGGAGTLGTALSNAIEIEY